MEHFPRQVDGVQHEAGADRARDALLKLLRQLIALLIDERPRHLDRQSQVLLRVGLSHEPGSVQFEVPHEICVQGGPSASGKKYVDIKFKVPLVAWVRGKTCS